MKKIFIFLIDLLSTIAATFAFFWIVISLFLLTIPLVLITLCSDRKTGKILPDAIASTILGPFSSVLSLNKKIKDKLNETRK